MTRIRSRAPSQVPGCLNWAAPTPPKGTMIESEKRKKTSTGTHPHPSAGTAIPVLHPNLPPHRSP